MARTGQQASKSDLSTQTARTKTTTKTKSPKSVSSTNAVKGQSTLSWAEGLKKSASGPQTFTVANASSDIECNIRKPTSIESSTIMIFTHGAGGTISTPAVANFAAGFVTNRPLVNDQEADLAGESTAPIICFNGSMNLKSRTSMFHAIIKHHLTSLTSEGAHDSIFVLGGRSMGARAAVMAASIDGKDIKKLVLVSYPLQGQNGDVRDQILLDIDAATEVLFVSGDKDNMCDLSKLNAVREKMKAKSWLLTVEGADHGMNCRQKKRTQEMQETTGKISAGWVLDGKIKTMSGDLTVMEGCKMSMSLPMAVIGNNQSDGRAAEKGSSTFEKRSRPNTDDDDQKIPVSKQKKPKIK